MKIIWSKKAIQDFENNIEFLNTEWNQSVVQNFTLEIPRVFKIIELNPKSFKFDKNNNCYVVTITKHISLFYRIKRDQIILFRFWNNYQNPNQIALKTNLITPSYVSEEMKALDAEAKAAGIIIMNEIGVDPGIDHMSASKILDEISTQDAVIHSFKSFCGGLIAPSNDTNPWNYKFTWNPRNVVIAGQGPAAAFIEEKEYKYIPYNRLFQRLETIEIEGYGKFEGYANRNSLSYRPIYQLDNIPTIYRGTLRRPGFSYAWNIFVELGMTEDSYKLENSEHLTPRNFINAFLPFQVGESVEDKFKRLFTKGDDELFHKFKWLGIFENDAPIGLKNASPAQLLEKILVEKWVLEENDKDMLVMYHDFEYSISGARHKIISSMVNIGENQVFTAMSNTVGLPVAICGKMILNGKLTLKGVQIPVMKEVYDPILSELENYGITFTEKHSII